MSISGENDHQAPPDPSDGELFINEDDIDEEVVVDMDHSMDDESDGELEGDNVELDGIVHIDNSVRHFPSHTQSVFCVAGHPAYPIAASGGEDDLGYLWDLATGDEIIKLDGHTDSVSSIEFSFDGELVATGGMDGKIRVWKRVGEGWKAWEFLTELEGVDEVMWLKWHPKGNVLLAGGQDGNVWLWQLPSGNTMQVFAGHTSPVSAGQFTPDGKRILTASEDGTLIFWDPRETTPVFKLTSTDGRFAFEGGITSLSVNSTSTLAVVGGADGVVRVVNLRKGEVIGALEGHAQGESVEAVSFLEWAGGPQSGAGGGVVATGGTDGKICVWDVGTMKLRLTLEHSDAVTTLISHPTPKSHLLTSASADKTLRTWDARTGLMVKEHSGHAGPILAAALSVRETGEQVIISAGDDSVCLVFNTD